MGSKGQLGGGGKKGCKNGVIRGLEASHDFFEAAKLQSAWGADNPRYAAAEPRPARRTNKIDKLG